MYTIAIMTIGVIINPNSASISSTVPAPPFYSTSTQFNTIAHLFNYILYSCKIKNT